LYEHREVHNLYGYFTQMATYEGLKRRNPSIRPFVLARAFYLGSHRYGTIWTGDCESHWNHLNASLPMMISMAMGGLSFTGTDIGGYKGNPDDDLLIRWFQFGVFNPFFRGHTDMVSSRREPWLFSDETNKRIHNAILMRYRLLPYLYNLFYEHSVYGFPIIRPMFYDYPNVPNEYMDKEMMIGRDILVVPILESTETVDADLPSEELWYSYHDNNKMDNGNIKIELTLDHIGVFIRGGAILPMFGRRRRSATIMRLKDPYTLVAYLDKEEKAEGYLYLDDGVSWNYTKEYLKKRFTFKEQEFVIMNEYKQWECDNKIERIIIVGYTRELNKIVLIQGNDTKELRYKKDDIGVVEIQNIGLEIKGEYRIKLLP